MHPGGRARDNQPGGVEWIRVGQVTTFALVHGAYHGGWCWEPLGRELEALGCRWVAPDLPCDDPTAGVADYAAAVIAAVDAASLADGEDLVVVGHSLGGLTAPVAAAARPTRRLVFLAAIVPEPGRAAVSATYPPEMSARWSEFSARRITGNGASRWLPDDAIEIFFHDCAADVARWAASRLRPQAFSLLQDPSPLSALPDVEYRYIACADDRTLAFGWQLDAARRLRVDPVVLAGGHSPFLARPREVALILADGLAARGYLGRGRQ
jgi:pimeloyl-ACP methyl ester carboxylesterase